MNFDTYYIVDRIENEFDETDDDDAVATSDYPMRAFFTIRQARNYVNDIIETELSDVDDIQYDDDEIHVFSDSYTRENVFYLSKAARSTDEIVW